jgi:hypothetical protein
MKQKIFKTTLLTCLFSCTTISLSLWAGKATLTTANSSEQQTIPALQIIEPAMILNRQMIKSAKLAAFDNKIWQS